MSPPLFFIPVDLQQAHSYDSRSNSNEYTCRKRCPYHLPISLCFSRVFPVMRNLMHAQRDLYIFPPLFPENPEDHPVKERRIIEMGPFLRADGIRKKIPDVEVILFLRINAGTENPPYASPPHRRLQSTPDRRAHERSYSYTMKSSL